jgi:hypothetical protein
MTNATVVVVDLVLLAALVAMQPPSNSLLHQQVSYHRVWWGRPNEVNGIAEGLVGIHMENIVGGSIGRCRPMIMWLRIAR